MVSLVVPREELERLVGKRRVRHIFGDAELIPTVDALRLLLTCGYRHMTARLLSRILRVSSVTLRMWRVKGRVRASKVDRYWYYDVASIIEYLSSM